MKKHIRLLAALLALTLALSLSAFAADFTALADELHTMGMFEGTNKGYELERVPTRGEAAVMLVRLLGQEDAAKAAYEAGTLTHPYVDAQELWVAPAVAYLYVNGLTTGMGFNAKNEPIFGMRNPCNAQMYATFLLRSLGYTDQGAAADFAYADALTYGAEKGVMDALLQMRVFDRDTLVAASYQALATPVKSAEGTLLEKLIKDGAIDKTAAAGTLAKIETFEKFNDRAGALVNVKALDMSMTMGMKMTTTDASGVKATVEVPVAMALQVDMASGKTLMHLALEAAGEKTEMWYRDGWQYTKSGDVCQKVEMADPMETMTQAGLESVTADSGAAGLYMFGQITEATTAAGTTYTVTMSDGFYSLMDELMTLIAHAAAQGDSVMTMDLSDIQMGMQFAPNGDPKTMTFTMAMDMTVDGAPVGMTMDCTIDINALGDKVSVVFPADLETCPVAVTETPAA